MTKYDPLDSMLVVGMNTDQICPMLVPKLPLVEHTDHGVKHGVCSLYVPPMVISTSGTSHPSGGS